MDEKLKIVVTELFAGGYGGAPAYPPQPGPGYPSYPGGYPQSDPMFPPSNLPPGPGGFMR